MANNLKVSDTMLLMAKPMLCLFWLTMVILRIYDGTQPANAETAITHKRY